MIIWMVIWINGVNQKKKTTQETILPTLQNKQTRYIQTFY